MVNQMVTYYQVLGIEPHVSSTEIKKAYRKLVKSYHPDVDYSESDESRRSKANEYMMRLNEAYSILIDKPKRTQYDALIGTNGRRHGVKIIITDPVAEEEARETFLRRVFHPVRQDIMRVLTKYKQQLRDLSLDIYDDRLVAVFEKYVHEVELVLIHSGQLLSSEKNPKSLETAVQMLRYAVAQAADGLDEMKRFCQNYDYSHLSMASSLFRISNDLLRKSLHLSKI